MAFRNRKRSLNTSVEVKIFAALRHMNFFQFTIFLVVGERVLLRFKINVFKSC